MATAPAERIFEVCRNISREMRDVNAAALDEIGYAVKREVLADMAAVWPSGGFSRHKRPTGRRLIVRYHVKGGSEPHLAVWAVPPGPQLVEGGASPHQISTTWGEGNVRRRIRHSGFRGRPFFDDSHATGEGLAVRVLERRNAVVLDRALR